MEIWVVDLENVEITIIWLRSHHILSIIVIEHIPQILVIKSSCKVSLILPIEHVKLSLVRHHGSVEVRGYVNSQVPFLFSIRNVPDLLYVILIDVKYMYSGDTLRFASHHACKWRH
jgi:hypothetical protein